MWCHITLRYSWNDALLWEWVEWISLRKSGSFNTLFACKRPPGFNYDFPKIKKQNSNCPPINELLSCTHLWRQMCHKMSHIWTVGEFFWKPLWNFVFSTEVLPINCVYYSNISGGHRPNPVHFFEGLGLRVKDLTSKQTPVYQCITSRQLQTCFWIWKVTRTTDCYLQ